MSLLGSVKITAVPEIKADVYKGLATIAGVTESETDSGKVQVAIKFEYEDGGRDKTFTQRYFIDPAWLDESYVVLDPNAQERGSDESKEAFAYQLNLGKVRKLFKLLDLDTIDFDQLEGKSIGISLGPESDKRDPSRQELKSYFVPKA